MLFNFSLLAGLLLFLSVNAIPRPRTNSGIVTLALKRLDQRSDVHPQIAHQQNINRSHRRYARMTGRTGPTTDELTVNLRKRLLSIEVAEVLAKRFNRVGVPNTPNTKAAGSGAALAVAMAKAEKGGKGTHHGKAKAAAVTQTVTPANPPTANNSLGLSIEGSDVGYLATVQIGTPPQNFVMLMDSGSADMWVGSENCQSQQGGCGNHRFLGAQSSSSFKNSTTQFQVTYGTGNVAGNVVRDTLAIAGLTLNAHTFGVANIESVDFASNTVPFDGLIGLAQSFLSNQKTLTPIEALAKAGLVTSAITSFKIPRLADKNNTGEVTFGGLDNTKFDAQTLVTLLNVNPNGFWEAAVDGVSVSGKNLGLAGRTAIFDTGTTLIIAPQVDANAIHQAIPGAKSDGQGGFTVPCNTNASLAMTFGGKVFAIDPRDLAVQPLNPNNPTGDCVSGIAAGTIGGANEWLMGDVFLKNAYFSTDVAKNTVTLAKLV
ncbi:aspartic peptidase A1 [Tricholoma matsutake]|nr:aspartic peptidase A1 [Tricholoma matsutake 945]